MHKSTVSNSTAGEERRTSRILLRILTIVKNFRFLLIEFQKVNYSRPMTAAKQSTSNMLLVLRSGNV